MDDGKKSTHEFVRKRRTRQQVIEDLSINYLERFIYKEGHAVDRPRHDYGIDLVMTTFSKNTGEIENGSIYFQLKATDSIETSNDGNFALISVQTTHLNHWMKEPYPVILVLYDAHQKKAYWYYIQANIKVKPATQTFLLRIPKKNKVNSGSIRKFARLKNEIIHRAETIIRHHE
jgi:hypothetical protein